eukprot:6845577-Pyramimonas_sp.AAC.1
MAEAGYGVALGEHSNGGYCDYLEHQAPGRRIVIYERNGAFQFDIVVPEGKGPEVEEVTDNRGWNLAGGPGRPLILERRNPVSPLCPLSHAECG